MLVGELVWVEVGIVSQEGKRKMSEDDVFGISGFPLRRASWGPRWRGEHQGPGLALLALPCPLLAKAQ